MLSWPMLSLQMPAISVSLPASSSSSPQAVMVSLLLKLAVAVSSNLAAGILKDRKGIKCVQIKLKVTKIKKIVSYLALWSRRTNLSESLVKLNYTPFQLAILEVEA